MITVILKPGFNSPGYIVHEGTSQYFTQNVYRISGKPQSWRPPTDIYETEDQYIVLVEIAGMQESDFTLTIDQSILNITGYRTTPVVERRAFHQMEIPFGEFILQIEIPALIDVEKIEAMYDNGFLRISLPKEKPRRIEITNE